MSLIVDINPVPWEILELVKARILKNRAKRQPQEQLGELKRAMSLRPGPLSRKRREEEPSFVGQGNTPYFAFLISGNPTVEKIERTFKPGYENLMPYETDDRFNYNVIYKPAGSVTFKLGGTVLGDIVSTGSANTWLAYLFIWSDNHETQKDLINSDKTFTSGTYSVREFVPINFNDANIPTERQITAVFDWKIIVIDKNKLLEPGPGDRLKLELLPLGADDSISQGNFCAGYYEKDKPVYISLGSNLKVIIEYPVDPDKNPIFWPADHVFSD